jgi:hypothetical protein
MLQQFCRNVNGAAHIFPPRGGTANFRRGASENFFRKKAKIILTKHFCSDILTKRLIRGHFAPKSVRTARIREIARLALGTSGEYVRRRGQPGAQSGG